MLTSRITSNFSMLRARLENTFKRLQRTPARPWRRTYLGRQSIPGNYHLQANRAYELAQPVSMAINMRMKTVGMAQLHVMEQIIEDGKEKYERAPYSHPLTQLLRNPGPRMTRYDLLSETVARLDLEGNCFYYLHGDRTPTGLEIIPSRYMWINANPDNGEVESYYYQPGHGNFIELHPDTVVHIRTFNPNNEYWGMSRLSATMAEASGDIEMARMNQEFFGPRKGIPSQAVEVGGIISQKDFEKMRSDWENSTGGTWWFRTGANQVSVKMHQIGSTPIEQNFLASRQANKNQILENFQISYALFDARTTEAASITAERTYYNYLHSDIMFLTGWLTKELAPFYSSYLGEFIIEADDIRPVDRELQLREIETAGKHLSINEIRERYYQLSSVEWGEQPAAGAGAAAVQFGGPHDYRRAFDEGRESQNNPPPEEMQTSNDKPSPQTRGTEPERITKQQLAKAQRVLLKAWDDASPVSEDDFTLHLPEQAEEFIMHEFATVKSRDDILHLFDPFFSAIESDSLKSIDADLAWVRRQLNKLPEINQRLITDGIENLNAVTNDIFAEKLKSLDALDFFEGV